MMPREIISFLRPETERSKSGQLVENWVPASETLTNVPAERRKRKTASNVSMNAKEEFVELGLTFWIRYDSSINSDYRIVYEGQIYRILDIDRVFHDNSCLVTVVKVND